MYSSPKGIWIRIRFLDINGSPSQEPFPDPCFGKKHFFNECAHSHKAYILYIFPDNDHIQIGMKWGRKLNTIKSS